VRLKKMQSIFQCSVPRGALAAQPCVGPTFQTFSLIEEQLADSGEVDQDDTFAAAPQPDTIPKSRNEVEDLIDPESEGDSEPSDSDIDSEDDIPPDLPPPGPPKGYTYTPFEPKPDAQKLAGNIRTSPTQQEALAVLADLKPLIRPKRQTGPGYQDPELDIWTRARLEGMQSMLFMYTNSKSQTYNNWGASSFQTAIGMGRGRHCARRLRQLCRGFIHDRKVLPVNPYGDWNESMLVDENLRNEISIYLLSIGNEISAKKLMDFLHQPDIKEKYGIERSISHKTACRYLNSLGYRYKAAPKGQYADGHEREDVVFYRENIFLPQWQRIQDRMAGWDEQQVDAIPDVNPDAVPPRREVIVWFHDESVFYAHDRRKKGWYHKDAPAKPYAKGEGASLMVADFVSTRFGWLRSRDGKRSARRLFKPGKNRDGYFSNEDIQEQAQTAMDILLESYPQFDHVLVYNNATTHLKRADDALSARRMPKNIPRQGTNWGIQVMNRNAVTGKPISKPDGMYEKIKIRMKDGQLPFYFPEGHPRAGVFKGMAVILEERGVGDMSRVPAECKNFKCKAGATNCCCRRVLYNQPDFANVTSVLEAVCATRGVQILFLPKFHCELNFIEQCWGRAKSVYRTYPESSREDHLEANMIMSLESIPLSMMQKFFTRSLRFMDAYRRGLNGRQAAWATRRYRGHRVLPNNIMDDLEKEGIL
jgi:hypothetical protein